MRKHSTVLLSAMVLIAVAGLTATLSSPANAIGFGYYAEEREGVSFTWIDLTCYDFAKAWVKPPGGDPDVDQQVNGHPSIARRFSEGNAAASARANGCTREISTGWIVGSPSGGWSAGAQAKASRTLSIFNATAVIQHIEFAFVLFPELVAKSRDGDGDGEIVIDYTAYESDTAIWLSHTLIDSWSAERITDSTGKLAWEKKTNIVEGFGETYLQTTELVPVRNYAIDINPGQEFLVTWGIQYESSIDNVDAGTTFDERIIPEPSSLMALVGGLGCLTPLIRRRR